MPDSLSGCGCVWTAPDIVDTTDCRIHPLTCEAIHPVTGIGCHHEPGHTTCHAYTENYQWTDAV